MLTFSPGPVPATLQATLDRFDALLRASGSATSMLIAWLAERDGTSKATLLARVRAIVTPGISPAILSRLGVENHSEVRYRRVWLTQGGKVMSIAENWYVGARLTGDMEAVLADSGTPFGAVIAPLAPMRETLHAERLWGGEEETASVRLPGAVLRHDALVHAGDGTPLCVVSEVYTRNILL
ncbi:MAG: hypothetical protein KA533_05250 [Sphingobium sp.]|nr:hypothetical protein [Sphingobium sp.]MBP6110813.1 hypothetical protein [Sphingobium sp.]MBP8671936.1 hypothetical protein [Sphingobium sp.]MBP9157501.1 hypothetical protein [Sphingobium sp.]MCC6480906.1 hypothetical protein [Sphingomonadaceae bacterium]